MQIKRSHIAFLLVGAVIGAAFINPDLNREVHAAKSPTTSGAMRQSAEHYYYAGTEQLAADEMRVTALGTGPPPNIQHRQASSCWLVELGNGDVFLFDIGTGCAANLAALDISWSHFDKIFLRSTCTPIIFGDLGALYVAGNLMGRTKPLQIWGSEWTHARTRYQSSHRARPRKAYAWDKRSRQGRIPVTGMENNRK